MREHSDMNKIVEAKDECLRFYAKSFTLFEDNVLDKLKDLNLPI
jgi:hypothetical protein